MKQQQARSPHLRVDERLAHDPLPKYKQLKEDNVREGFIEDDVYRAILSYLPRHQKMLFCFARYLGIRKGELLEFRWNWLLPYWREEEPIIKVPGKYCKGGKAHTIPIYHPEMRAFVEMALTERNLKCPYLFQYQGKRLKNTRTGWEKARQAAGVPELIFHDTRRSAIRLMEQAKIPRHEAMQISGHKTESVYKRYDIASEKGAADAGMTLRSHCERLAARQKAEKLGEKLRDVAGEDPRNENQLPGAKLIN